MNQGRKQFAPETAVGTGAAEPLVDEVEAAKQVPSVDESTAGQGKNYPGNEGDASNVVVYSGEQTAENANDLESTGEDWETRNRDNDDVPLAGAAVNDPATDDAEVNKPVQETRPEVPQATKRARKAADKA